MPKTLRLNLRHKTQRQLLIRIVNIVFVRDFFKKKTLIFNVFMQLEQHQEVLMQFDQAILINPNELAAYNWKGFSLENYHMYAKAIQKYRQAQSLLGNQQNEYYLNIFVWQKQRRDN
ncbi:unnamed protein product [Paramecium octaurelia]|uniref:Photosystem I assembly protein Ycf3 n=1 Tax=Paramecium octaurelia TaxID=43137 RepID=A0A8S1YED5_PAROT|nr:unnamed protein product [Paramecium octaurelia]